MSATIEAPRTLTPPLQPEAAELERQPESVINLLLERVERGYRRGIDDDGHKIGLAFDPGGLAGVVSAAMARKLSLTGVLEVVDGFYGLSSGGFNALYAASGQLQEGIEIYKDLAPDNGLVKPAKLIPPRLPEMNLEVLRDALYASRPIDVRKIVEQEIPVVIGATDLSQPLERPVMFRSTDLDPEHADRLIEQALAGGHIPVVSGEPIKENGHIYTDATMTWASTIELARKDGCTDVLSLANLARSEKSVVGRKERIATYLTGKIGDKYLDKHSPKLPPLNVTIRSVGLKSWIFHPFGTMGDILLDMIGGDRSIWDVRKYNDTLKRKVAAEKQFDEDVFIVDGVNVERLYPPAIPGLPELLTMDKKKLRVGIRAGRLAIRRALQEAQTSLAKERT